MNNMALLIVDVQKAMIEDHPYHEKELLENIGGLLKTARQNRLEIIYVRHNGRIGDELEPHTEGWEIDASVSPKPTEKIFDKKFNSAFKGTGLKEYLSEKNIDTIVLVGMQTEYCIDTTCKVAFEYGFSVLIPEGTTATYDNASFSGVVIAQYYEQEIWNNRFAEVIPLEGIIKRMAPRNAE